LWLLYEDVLHCREDATSKLLFPPVLSDLRARVARHGAAAEFYAEKADQLLTVEDGMAYARRFDECLASFEEAVRQEAPSE
jgi:hypothetical protein